MCVESLEAARAAEAGGAHRIELCTELSIGGVTPGFGLMRDTIEALSIPVHVMIRPRGGNFTYSGDEFEQMRGQIETAKRTVAEAMIPLRRKHAEEVRANEPRRGRGWAG